MNRLSVISLLLFCGPVLAAPVTITFDDTANQTITTEFQAWLGDDLTIVTYQGFEVSMYPGLSGDTDKAARGITLDVPFRGPEPVAVTVRRSDGGAFAFYGADIDWSGVAGSMSYVNDSGYHFTEDLSGFGSGDWLDVTQISFEPTYLAYSYVLVDNIVVSAVPIPAAVWMFGSALAGLWVSRRAAVQR